MTDPHFLVWMRPAAFPNFKKIYGKIDSKLKQNLYFYFMIKLELTESEFESLMLKYELGKLIEGDIVEEDGESILASSDLQQKLYKSGFEGGSNIPIKNNERFKFV